MANLKTIKPLLLLIILAFLPEFSFSQFNFPSFPEPKVQKRDLKHINKKLDKALDKKDFMEAAYYSKLKRYYEAWIKNQEENNSALEAQYKDSIIDLRYDQGSYTRSNLRQRKSKFSFYVEASQLGYAGYSYFKQDFENPNNQYKRVHKNGVGFSVRFGQTLRTFSPFADWQVSLNVNYLNFQLMTPNGDLQWEKYYAVTNAPGFGLNVTRFLKDNNNSIDFTFNSSLLGGFLGDKEPLSGLTINLQPRLKMYYNQFNFGLAYDLNVLYDLAFKYPGPAISNAFYFFLGYNF